MVFWLLSLWLGLGPLLSICFVNKLSEKISTLKSPVLPGLVIYHQLRDFWRSIGDKIFVQITSDLLVISAIGKNLGKFKPFLVKIGDILAFSHKFSTWVFGNFLQTEMKCYKENFYQKICNFLKLLSFLKKLSHKNAIKAAFEGNFC